LINDKIDQKFKTFFESCAKFIGLKNSGDQTQNEQNTTDYNAILKDIFAKNDIAINECKDYIEKITAAK